MNIRQTIWGCLGALLCLLPTACTTEHASRKGHWETLPMVTGSMVQRKVWVDENGNVSNPRDVGNVQGASAAGFERAQRNSVVRPRGN